MNDNLSSCKLENEFDTSNFIPNAIERKEKEENEETKKEEERCNADPQSEEGTV